MPLETLSARAALDALRLEGSKVKWPDASQPGRRLEGMAKPAASPSFAIGRGDPIFTMGSCFARNIERRLVEVGMKTVMRTPQVEAQLAALDEVSGYTNKYNVSCMRAEIEWALGAAPPPPREHLLLPMPGGKVFDAFMLPKRPGGAAPETALALRALIEGRMRRLAKCRVVILTLGLVEVWLDRMSGLRLNGAPPARLMEAEPERFVLEVLSYGDILEELERIHAALTAHGHPDVRLVLTVSPVPLKRTYRAMDVLSANSYSKSVQRAAVEAFVATHGNVDYFPSYEAVTLTDRRVAYDIDNRHVQEAVVARVVDSFLTAYAPEVKFEALEGEVAPSGTEFNRPDRLYTSAKVLMAEMGWAEAAPMFRRLLEEFTGRHPFVSDAGLRVRLGACLAKIGDRDGAIAALRQVPHDEGATPADCQMAAERLGKIGDAEGARLVRLAMEARFPQGVVA